MSIKIVNKVLLAFVLIISAVLAFQIPESKAASTKNGWVSISSGTLNVRSGPGTNYKSVGSLKNNAQVTVYSQTKSGWSEIRYNNKKAYVSSKYLRMYSYLRDKTKLYTYESGGQRYTERFIGTEEGWDKWTSSGQIYVYREDNRGLYAGWYDSEFLTELVYPLKAGKEWTDIETERKWKITALNGTLKTRAGTFKNVVTAKSQDGYTDYYALNVGLIKSVYKGETSYELIKLVKKK
ncbi:SH3 domain-containing protein [Domibacillus sp.]|uniref:SH3 domain-containing protein n=1 Tax=Domibacillus sp. TaxID=1969783 RepID=UPI0028115F0A|nr:SH3 domain-containing protein [Domibacillus sp.]